RKPQKGTVELRGQFHRRRFRTSLNAWAIRIICKGPSMTISSILIHGCAAVAQIKQKANRTSIRVIKVKNDPATTKQATEHGTASRAASNGLARWRLQRAAD